MSGVNASTHPITGEEFRSIFKKIYTTMPTEEMEAKSFNRSQAKSNFPYISFKQSEAVKLTYALKVMDRKNAVAAIFDAKGRPEVEAISSANRRLKGMVDKGYLNFFKFGKPASHWYVLTEQSFQYLRRRPYNTEFSSRHMVRLNAVNQRFTALCDKYRETHVIDWETEPVVTLLNNHANEWRPTAVAVVWEDKTKTKAVEAHIYETLKSTFVEDQLLEIERLQEKYANTHVWKYFPVTPEVILVNTDNSEELKLIENREVVASREEIERWLGL